MNADSRSAAIETRIALLEDEVRGLRAAQARWRASAAIAGATAAVAVLVACQPQGEKPGAVSRATPSPTAVATRAPAAGDPTREIRLVSADGMQELILRPEGLALRVEGKNRAVLRSGATTSLVLGDSAGRARVSLLSSDGPGALSLLGPGGKDLAVVAANEDDALARVELFEPSTGSRAALRVDRAGRGALHVDGNGAGRTAPPMALDESPAGPPAPADGASDPSETGP